MKSQNADASGSGAHMKSNSRSSAAEGGKSRGILIQPMWQLLGVADP